MITGPRPRHGVWRWAEGGGRQNAPVSHFHGADSRHWFCWFKHSRAAASSVHPPQPPLPELNGLKGTIKLSNNASGGGGGGD